MANQTVYRLTADERACARTVAQIRNTLNHGQPSAADPLMDSETRLAQHYRACVAEIAVCRLTNFSWSGCGPGADGRRDVGDSLEVRSVTSRHKGLLVRQKDFDDTPYVLVLVDHDGTEGEILGWAMKEEVMARGTGRDLDSHPYWTLPVIDLHSAAMLPLWRSRHDDPA